MGLNRTSKNNPCPVCGSGTKGCSYDLSTEVFLCRGESNNPEFTLTKYDGNGLFGIYVPTSKTKKEFSPEEKAAWLKAKREREEAENQRFLNLLSVDARDAKYRALEQELGLFTRHKEELQRRGVEDGYKLGFRSAKKFQKIKSDVEKLAGFSNQKYKGYTGILCPVRDVNGKLIGYQVANDTRDPKYPWLRTGDISSHLQNKEMPINVANYGNNTIGFCEGILKSSVAAHRLQATFIGASTVGSTPIQIAEVIKHFNLIEVKLYVDAGSASNSSVLKTMSNFNDVVTKLGCKVLVADWGQWFDKSEPDIDEIDSLDGVTYRDFAFYKSCGRDASNYTRQLPEAVEKTYSELSNLLSNTRANNHRRIEFQCTSQDSFQEFQGTLPDSEDVESAGNYSFSGLATDIYTEAIKQGYTVILDTSPTGSGKTKAASELDLNTLTDFGIGKLIYASKSSRNVNNEVLETEFTRLPSRHAGYDFDHQKLTPSGKPSLIPTEKEVPDVVSNCKFLDLFNLSRSKNLELDICGKCDFKKACRSKSGEGHGYKKEMRQASKASKLRGTVAALSDSSVNSNTLLVVDEYSQSVPWIKNISITEQDINEAANVIRSIYASEDMFDDEKHPEAEAGLDILNKLLTALDHSTTNAKYRFGISLSEVIRLVSLDDYDSKTIDGLVAMFEITTSQENEEFFAQANSSTLKSEATIDQLVRPRWFAEFISTINRSNLRSSLTIRGGRLELESVDQRILDNLDNARAVIYQDATGSKSDLALKLGIDPKHILEVRQDALEGADVTLNQIVGLSQAGNRRRESCQTRLDALREWFYEEHGQENVGCIDFKKFAKPGDLVHFVDGRGSNAFQHKDVVVSFGLPIKNLTAVQSEYQLFTGRVIETLEDEEFQSYVSNLISAEVIQEAGRLRANRRPDESLEYVVVSDSDLSFMNNLGFEVIKTHVMSYLPEQGSKSERIRAIVLETVQTILDEDDGIKLEDIRQADIVKQTGISQSTLSKLAKKFGGWVKFKSMLKLLIGGVDSSQITDRDRERVADAKAYLPYVLDVCIEDPEAVDEMMELMPIEHEEAYWHALFEDIPLHEVAKFVSKLILVMPRSLRNDFLVSLRTQYDL